VDIPVGELSLRLGHISRAMEYLSIVVRSSDKKSKKQLIEMARDRWYQAQDLRKENKGSKH